MLKHFFENKSNSSGTESLKDIFGIAEIHNMMQDEKNMSCWPYEGLRTQHGVVGVMSRWSYEVLNLQNCGSTC